LDVYTRILATGTQKRWDNFSVYLTVRDQHLREIEAILLRIGKPRGNGPAGRLAQSLNLWGRVNKAVAAKHAHERRALLPKNGRLAVARKKVRPREGAKAEASAQLSKLFPNGTKLRATLKGQSFKGRLRADGSVRTGGKLYKSLSASASALCGRSANGWSFWQAEQTHGVWMRLTRLRKVGLPG
jgi:hypothetical protein